MLEGASPENQKEMKRKEKEQRSEAKLPQVVQ
jgi:hypothetical protein